MSQDRETAEMDLTQVLTEQPLLQPVQRRSTRCYHWLSIFSFVLLLGATVILALLHFQIIPSTNKEFQEEFQMPEILQIKSVLDAVPQTQAMQMNRAAAHMIGKSEHGKIIWKQRPNVFNGFKFVANKLEIQKDGLYFVYTQVVYTGPDCKGKSIDLTHTVKKMSFEDFEEDILTSTKTVCQVHSPYVWNQPIYQASLVRLEKGDTLYTETTHKNLLNFNKNQVSFGVLAID